MTKRLEKADITVYYWLCRLCFCSNCCNYRQSIMLLMRT